MSLELTPPDATTSSTSDNTTRSQPPSQHATTACPPTFTDLQYYIQIAVLAITTLVCLGAIIADPVGPNVRYFESVATFCIGLFLPNPRQSVAPSS